MEVEENLQVIVGVHHVTNGLFGLITYPSVTTRLHLCAALRDGIVDRVMSVSAQHAFELKSASWEDVEVLA